MKLLLVEDDYLQWEYLKEELENAFPEAAIEVISTELEFRKRLSAIEASPPRVVIMDVMLRWTDPSKNVQEAPPEVERESFHSAGQRCARLLRERSQDIPVIFFTVLERSDLERTAELDQSVVLKKDGDLSLLINEVRRLAKTGKSRE